MIKVVGIVNGTPDFIGHGKVVNGASDMFVEVLGDRGRHARTCTGAGSLPAAVTVECIVRFERLNKYYKCKRSNALKMIIIIFLYHKKSLQGKQFAISFSLLVNPF